MPFKHFPHEFQMDAKDCGPACLMIIAKYYGKYYSLQYLRDLCGITREGVSMLDISYAADKIGLRTLSVEATMADLRDRVVLPAIIHWDNHHFIVVYKVTKNSSTPFFEAAVRVLSSANHSASPFGISAAAAFIKSTASYIYMAFTACLRLEA